MTNDEIVDLAAQVGLHCDHEDDPEGEETILLWHDADVDGGLLIRFHDGQPQIIELRAANQTAKTRKPKDPSKLIRRCIDDYATRCNALPLPPLPRPLPRPPVSHHAPTEKRDHDWRLPSQRREGAFKAVDPLGHFYYVEVFREVSAKREDTAIQRLMTADGESVERIAKGRYRLSQASLELSSTDPDAP